MVKRYASCDPHTVYEVEPDFPTDGITEYVAAEDYDALAARLAEEKAIVDRIWDIYGRPTYEQLAGRTIYDLINADRARLAEAEALIRCLIDNDPNDDAADAVTVYQVWRKDAERFLRPADSAPAAPAFATGHCEHHKQPGGCKLHNLHCGWPECDRGPVSASLEPKP